VTNEILFSSRFKISDSRYFYINQLESKPSSHTIVDASDFVSQMSSSPVSELIRMIQIKPYYNSVAEFFLLTIILLSIINLLYSFLRNWLPQLLSAVLITILLLAPQQVSLHEVLFSRNLDFEYSSLFAALPVPGVTLLGFSLILEFARRLFLSAKFPIGSTVGFLILLYLIHPILIPIFTAVIWSNMFVRAGRKFWSRNLETSMIVTGVATSTITLVIFLASLSSKEYLGTFTSSSGFDFDIFDFLTYQIIPPSMLIFGLIYFRISLQEVIFKFYAIVGLYVLESSIYLVSFLLQRDFSITFRFHGLIYAFHILYYLPALYVLTSRKISRKWSHSLERLESIENIFLRGLSVLSILLLSVCLTRITVLMGTPENGNSCKIVNEVIDRKLAKLMDIRENQYSDALVSFGLENLSYEQFQAFMENPFRRSSIANNCGYKGLGFLLLNGFRFDEDAVQAARLTVIKYKKGTL
jgi:hypothetical protein